MKQYTWLLVTYISLLGCKKENNNNNRSNLDLNIAGLQDVGANARYEGWIIVNGSPVTTGVFTVNSAGQMSATTFNLDKQQVASATDFVLTIEPYPDNSPLPSGIAILAGSFSNNDASLKINHPKALNTDFASSTGKYLLTTPTTTTKADELSGIWFIDNTSGTPMAGLNLPALPAGWKYEGWVVMNNQPLTTGKFSSGTGADMEAPYSGTEAAGPPFPGEDLIKNAPTGFTFPTSLAGSKAVITIEPSPDNSPKPFFLKSLTADIPANASPMMSYSMMVNTNFPAGTAMKK